MPEVLHTENKLLVPNILSHIFINMVVHFPLVHTVITFYFVQRLYIEFRCDKATTEVIKSK